MSTKVFFESVCPKLLRLRRQGAQVLGGRYGFSMSGAGGGEWTLDFATGVVTRGIKGKLDSLLRMQSSDFEGLLGGELDVEAALMAGRISHQGSLSALGSIARIIAPLQAASQ